MTFQIHVKETEMNAGPAAALVERNAEEVKARLSTLWIVVMFALLTADVLSAYIPGTTEEMAEFAGEIPIPQLMLVAAILNAIPIVMIYLARVLHRRVSRWANIAAAVVTIVYVVGGGSTYPHYLFLAALEVVSLVAILWYAWRWAEEESMVVQRAM